MRSKDLAKAAGLAVVFDLTAHTFYRLSHVLGECASIGATRLAAPILCAPAGALPLNNRLLRNHLVILL